MLYVGKIIRVLNFDRFKIGRSSKETTASKGFAGNIAQFCCCLIIYMKALFLSEIIKTGYNYRI